MSVYQVYFDIFMCVLFEEKMDKILGQLLVTEVLT